MKLIPAILAIALTGCDSLNMDRTYTIGYGNARVGMTFSPRDGKQVIPPDGPDTAQLYSPRHGYNFGVEK